MSLRLYGLKNCDTCRKALKAFGAVGREYEFVDVRTDGVSAEQIAAWAGAVGWEKLLNTKSTTWRGLPDGEKHDVDEGKAVVLMAEHTTLVKRPVIEADGAVTVGWTADVQAGLGLG
ncbi:MAG: Spx/MgsR family RNA polymerase-binding regulatory protein [Alphaproteobacteria bacterium]|nr:Spx/MgsR family RNA polymerase-binding regulatory protein [Alphaproteobacteria bacterium]